MSAAAATLLRLNVSPIFPLSKKDLHVTLCRSSWEAHTLKDEIGELGSTALSWVGSTDDRAFCPHVLCTGVLGVLHVFLRCLESPSGECIVQNSLLFWFLRACACFGPFHMWSPDVMTTPTLVSAASRWSSSQCPPSQSRWLLVPVGCNH